MSWFADLAGRAESLLNNLDEQTGAALRNHTIKNPRNDKKDYASRPDASWAQRAKRPLIRNSKIATTIYEAKSTSPSRKSSPTHQSRPQARDQLNTEKTGIRQRKSPARPKPSQFHFENCPKTMVNDIRGDGEIIDHFGYRSRSYSLPEGLELINENDNLTLHLENLEVENTMVKNELNVMNREVSELLSKLRKAEDGNDVDRSKELSNARMKLEDSEIQLQKSNIDKNSLALQLELLKEKIRDIADLEKNYQGEKQSLIMENTLLKDANNDLEERVQDYIKKFEDTNSTQHKLETELRHAQSTINELQSNLEKSNQECQRLEKDWETYKLRVKSMLFAKDNEIKALQEGLNLTEDTKMLIEQVESLKEERDELSEAISSVRCECESMRQYLTQVENRHTAAERVVAALRDAMRDERAARNRAENHAFALSKELKILQNETGQTIASLRTSLRDKESEINHLLESTTSIKTTDASALNVADYEVSRDTQNEQIQYLTDTLVQRQSKIDKLLADNNMLRIQLDKLESKFKSEMSNRNNNHSIVNVQNAELRSRRAATASMLNMISNRMGLVIRKNPLLRIFVVIYMICLHFWVLTVLLTSTPAENLIPRSAS